MCVCVCGAARSSPTHTCTGKDIGRLQCQADFQAQNVTLQAALAQYIPRAEYTEKTTITTQQLRDELNMDIADEVKDRESDMKLVQDSLKTEIDGVKSLYDSLIQALDDRIDSLSVQQQSSPTSAEPPTYWVDNQVGDDVIPLTRLPANLFPLTVKVSFFNVE